MKRALKVDPMGRVVLPASWRKQHGVVPGMFLRVEEEAGSLRLDPVAGEPMLVEEDGVLVHRGRLEDEASDIVERVRSERDRRNWGLEG